MKKLFLFIAILTGKNALCMEENSQITKVLIPAIKALDVKRVEEFLSKNKINQSDVLICIEELTKTEAAYNKLSKIKSLAKLALGTTFFVPSFLNVAMAARMNEDKDNKDTFWFSCKRFFKGRIWKKLNENTGLMHAANYNLLTVSGAALFASSLAILDGATKLIKGDDSNHTKALAIKQLLLNQNL